MRGRRRSIIRRREDSSDIDRRTANAGTGDKWEGVSRLHPGRRLDRRGFERGDAWDDRIGHDASRQMLEHFALGTVVIGRMGGTAGNVRAVELVRRVRMAIGGGGGDITFGPDVPQQPRQRSRRVPDERCDRAPRRPATPTATAQYGAREPATRLRSHPLAISAHAGARHLGGSPRVGATGSPSAPCAPAAGSTCAETSIVPARSNVSRIGNASPATSGRFKSTSIT